MPYSLVASGTLVTSAEEQEVTGVDEFGVFTLEVAGETDETVILSTHRLLGEWLKVDSRDILPVEGLLWGSTSPAINTTEVRWCVQQPLGAPSTLKWLLKKVL